MNRNASMKKILAISVGLLIILFAVLMWMSNNVNTKIEKKYYISLIVYGSDTNRWENLRQGAELAGRDSNAEISLVTMSSDRSSIEQIQLIEREINDGADALIVAPCDSAAIGEYLDGANIQVPVVLVENDIISDANRFKCIGGDDYAMGIALGEMIKEMENPIVKVAIISDMNERANLTKREAGVREIIEPYASKVVTWERNDKEEKMITRKFLQRELTEEAVDVVVALDNEISDALMEALDNLNKHTKAYAISTSDQAVYCLDNNKIKGLEYVDEFSIGYMATKHVIGNDTDILSSYDGEAEYRLVTKEELYEPDNQKLLFPFVK